ncbi:hypothetical protein L6164_004293 [Bauhinia variegata]|uniref:Uncharacterized protein n=1 Tax=Bauhinia variegata TaxID=167791 RepID=A0ACB9Q4M8_BAUVA|nr:hypothetical protein L6164_004293 [Bauhinia variegata]
MAYRLGGLLYRGKHFGNKKAGVFYLNSVLYHCLEESHENVLPSEGYKNAFLKITELTQLLKNVDAINGRIVDISTNSTVIDDCIEHQMDTFKSLVRVFIGSPSVQHGLKYALASSAGTQHASFAPFSKASEREAMVIDSLIKVSNFLNISAQQRKSVRLTVCPQVTQHRIWTGALGAVLSGLKSDLDSLASRGLSKDTIMGHQIVHSCSKFLAENAISSDPESSSWMKLSPSRSVDSSEPHKWEVVLEMFNDLIESLRSEARLKLHVGKLEIMKEGLAQIKDVLVDNSIGYREARHQESLVQKKLTKTLGHPSRCLFTLLLYYLYGRVTDIEVDLCGGIYESGGDNRFCLSMGRILTSDNEKMVGRGVKQLDQALGIFKFIWETAGMKGHLDLQGHIWRVGAECRTLRYRGNVYFLHGISL